MVDGWPEDNKIPGLSIALVDRESLIWTAGFGHTDYDCKTPVTADTIFSIQSMSKTFTATAVMMAVQDGLVDLDTPITEYLPDFKVKSRFEEDPERKITLRHLLSHTSGLIQCAPVGNLFEHKCPSFEAHIHSISDTWLKFPVGASRSYSNQGMDLAAYILQVTSNQSFSEYMQEKIFIPLGMENSSLDIGFIKQHPNRAIGHQPLVKQVPLESPLIGAGAVYTSTSDLAKFIQFHLNWGQVDNHSILHSKHIEEMYTSSPSLGIFVNPNFEVPNKHQSVDGPHNHTPALDHGGGGSGFSTFMTWFPEYGIGVICLSNSNNDGRLICNVVYDLIRELMEDDLIRKDYVHEHIAWDNVLLFQENNRYQPPDPETFTPYKPEWKEYIGTYRPCDDWQVTLRGRIAIERDNYNIGRSIPRVVVRQQDGYLTANGQRLDEYQLGVFFTKEGDCLDFSGPSPRWKGVRIAR